MWAAIRRWCAVKSFFLIRQKDRISSATALCGLLVGVFGFGLTFYQLNRTTAALQAANSYQIQKDARDLTEKVHAAGIFENQLAKFDPQKERQFAFDVWRLANFYLSVYRQWRASGISRDFYESFGADFCGLFANANFKAEWETMAKQGELNSAQKAMRGAWCGHA